MKTTKILAALLFAALSSLSIADVTIDATDRGWYMRNVTLGTYTHTPENMNYLVGLNFNAQSQAVVTNSFFAFDLTAYAGQTFTSAQMALYNPKIGDPMNFPTGSGISTFDGFFQFNPPVNSLQCAPAPAALSGTPCERFELSDVTSDKVALVNGTGGQTAYDDLGNGTVYGYAVMTAADNGKTVVVNFNAAGLAAINAAAGGMFYVGGKNATIDTGGKGSQVMFAATDNDPFDTQLILTTVSAVPEPEAFAMLAAGVCVVGVAARRRRRQPR